MSDEIGYIGFNDENYFKKHSEKTQRKIDLETKKIIGKNKRGF
jgi:hypothetical protein